MTVQEFGNPKDWNWDSPSAVFSQFEKRLNLQKKCDTGSGCWVNKEITNLKLQDGENKNIDANTGYIKARFMDGMSLAFFANPSTPIITDSNGLRIYGVFYADVNGKKKPNEAGKDVVGFWITERGIWPMSDDDLTEVSTGGGTEEPDNHGCGGSTPIWNGTACIACNEPTPYWDAATNSCVASPVASLPDLTPCDYDGDGIDDSYKIPDIGCVAPSGNPDPTVGFLGWCGNSTNNCTSIQFTCPNGGRVPNQYEQQTIFRYSNLCTTDDNYAGGTDSPKVSAPCYTGAKIPGFTSSAFYWSSSEYSSSNAWYVSFYSGIGGRHNAFEHSINVSVRCVK